MGFLILIPAAGTSSRMRGADKLLEAVEGIAILRRQALIAKAACGRVLVTLPEGAAVTEPRRFALEGVDVAIAALPDAAEGMAASLRHGAKVALEAGLGLLVLPADMPEIAVADLRDLMSAQDHRPDAIVRAVTRDGRPGHPVLFPMARLREFADLRGDEGARSIVQARPSEVVNVTLKGERALIDLDTPEDWAAWRLKAG